MWEPILRESRWILNRCRRRFRSAAAFSLAFKALNLIVLAPLAAGILRLLLGVSGRASVGNFELAGFFLSPVGLAALLLVGSVLVASLYFELSGLLRIIADDRLHWWEALQSSARFFPRLVGLGLTQLAIYLALAVPFLAGIGLAYWWFWSGKDLNGLVIVKPPEFWWGAGCAAILAAVYAAVALVLFLRALFAVPILALEAGTTVRAALQTSAQRSRGKLWRSAGALGAWFVAQCLLAAAVLGPLQLVLQWLLSQRHSSLARVMLIAAAALVVQAAAATLLSVLGNVSFVGVVFALYRRVTPAELLAARIPEGPAESPSRDSTLGWRVAIGLIVTAVAVVVASVLWIRELKLHDRLEITAHRAGASAAPENTIAALKQAIADGADWAEIDVQLTADKALVVMHDVDLLRVGGGSRRVDQATLVEIQALDVGTPFGPQFAGERIPTLADLLAAAGEQMRLNIELKPHGRSDGPELTRRVVEEVRQTGLTSRCRICSQSYESLQLARQLEPGLEVGYIVATAIGDPTQLDVDFLMVKNNLATRSLVDRARLRGIAVHAWTVNDSALVGPLLDAGIDNLITDNPAQMRTQLDEILSLDTPERLLLRAVHAVAR